VNEASPDLPPPLTITPAYAHIRVFPGFGESSLGDLSPGDLSLGDERRTIGGDGPLHLRCEFASGED